MISTNILFLNGDWTLTTWEESPIAAPQSPLGPPAGALTLQAQVPGNAELDLVRAGLLPEMELGLNVRRLRAWEGHAWLYAKTFTSPALQANERAVLYFDGVDTLATYFLNGEKIGTSENMLVPHSFDVTERLRPGENLLQVLIRSALYESQRHTVGELGFHMGFADGEPLRKAAHMGGWDIFPRIYCAGLWRDVSLEVVPAVSIADVAWMCGNFSPDFSRCDVKAQFLVKGPINTFAWGNRIRATLLRNGENRAVTEREYVAVHNELYLSLESPDLWWPKGMGDPALYETRIEVLDSDGIVLASNTQRIGVRLIQLERDDVYGPDRPGQFLFRVNGEPCYIRGSNWVPTDAFPSRQAARTIETLEMFADLNCNMVRVWGGGVYETDAFYDWCDAHGLMVWQDFMTGCSVFPQDDRYARLTAEEVRSVVLRLRNHPSIALWAGNNENDDAFNWGAFREFRRNPNDERNSRRTIPETLWDLDITRPYLPSSPYASPDVAAGKALPYEMHLWGERAYYKVPFYLESPCWFASEMGYHGCPNRDSLERMISPECVYPWKNTPQAFEPDHHALDWNDEWRLKASDPYMRGNPGLWQRNDLMTNQIRILFGGVDTDLDTFIAQSQFIQAEAMKTFCERFRAGKFTEKNGLIWWNVRDGWPQISDAVVDYYGGKKRAYDALKNAQQDQIVCVVDDHTVWAVNDARRPVAGSVKVADAATGTVLLEADFTIPANGKTDLGKVPFEGQGVLLIHAVLDGRSYANHFLYGRPPFDWKKVCTWLLRQP